MLFRSILVVDVTTAADKKQYNKVILGGSGTMSDAEVKSCIKNMERLKISPAEKEENRLLIARAERIYEESFAEEREAVGTLLSVFQAALKAQNSRDIRTAYERLSELLDGLDN